MEMANENKLAYNYIVRAESVEMGGLRIIEGFDDSNSRW